MKIALLQIEDEKHPNVYGDFAGGFGAGFVPGKNFLSRVIGFAKHYGLDLPLMSFGYLAAIFSQAGHELVVGRNMKTDADLIIIHSSLTGWKHQVAYAAQFKHGKRQRVGFIGPFSAVKSDLFATGAHFIIKGEPEQAAIRLSAGEILEGVVDSPPVKNLDTLPFPHWDPFHFIRFTYFPSLLRRPIFPILASRGCPDKCIYCPYKVQFNTFRARSLENIIAEMKWLMTKKKAAGFLFRDPFFSFSRKRTEKFAQMLINEKIYIPWVCETKLESLDEDLILLLKRTGLKTINIGIESAQSAILEQAGRTVYDEKRVLDLLQFCDQHGVKITGFFIIGWPEDTRKSIEATIAFAQKLNPHI
ncbi:B12-binding domain-containing radical SAM protein, partial [candidate division CSSED10-310 bacterium]